MPKMRTHKGATKRIHVTESGKIMRRKRVLGARVKATKTSLTKTRRPVELASVHKKVVKQMVPGTKGASKTPKSTKTTSKSVKK